MELEVGMYVRTKYGISKIEEDRRINYGLIHPVVDILKKEVIIKSINNIIDLIEEGDFITLGENNYPLQVRNVWEHAGDIHIELSNGAKFEDLHDNKDFKIYSIVTKEMYESICYKVED